MKNKIIFAIICTALACGMCGCNNSGEDISTDTGITSAVTETEAADNAAETQEAAADNEYGIDFDTAVSNIIAAGIEADDSEFILSKTEETDDAAYYVIIKGCDNGESVLTEEIFRVNVSDGSVYLYVDPTLPMSGDQVRFAGEPDENDPKSRYIPIYDGEKAIAPKSETAAETSASKEKLTVSPSGYVLDPSVTLGEHEYADMFAENQPCFIDETDEGVRVYGVNTDTEREYHYINPFEEYFSTKSCVILEHNGIAEEFAGEWGERFGTAMSVYSDDFDGDGETEIATCRYDNGGTFCRVMELVLYKQKDGRYEQIVFSANDFNKEYITVDIDNEKKSLTLSINGFDKSFSYDFSEAVPPEMTEFKLNMLQVNDFAFDGGKITYKVTPLLTSYAYEMFADISFTLDLSDGEFVCTDVEFIKEEF